VQASAPLTLRRLSEAFGRDVDMSLTAAIAVSVLSSHLVVRCKNGFAGAMVPCRPKSALEGLSVVNLVVIKSSCFQTQEMCRGIAHYVSLATPCSTFSHSSTIPLGTAYTFRCCAVALHCVVPCATTTPPQARKAASRTLSRGKLHVGCRRRHLETLRMHLK
jgi:hypothetical protein